MSTARLGDDGRASALTSRDLGIAALLAMLCLAGLLLQHPFERALLLDAATWDSLSVGLARGEIPYRDVFLHKTTGAALLGSIGARIAGALGRAPVHGAHAVFLLLGALGPPLLYLACRPRLGLVVALTAAAWMAGSDLWLVATLEGVRPKVATVDCGLAALVLAQARWPLAAGVLAAASALCWQPGLVFAAGAAIELRGHDGRRAWWRAAAGAALVAAAFLAWLVAHGALGPFLADAVVFNGSYIGGGLRAPGATFLRAWDLVAKFAPLEGALSLVALAVLAILRPRVPTGLLLASFLYGGALFASLQGWPDLLLLTPALAVLPAVGLAQLLDRRGVGPGSALVVAILALAVPGWQRVATPVTFEQQAADVRRLLSGVAADRPVVAIGAPEILLHAGRGRDWPWPYFWFGVDAFAARREGGFPAVLNDLERLRPEMIVIARRWKGPYREMFREWASRRYDREQFAFFPHLANPCEVWRRKSDP